MREVDEKEMRELLQNWSLAELLFCVENGQMPIYAGSQGWMHWTCPTMQMSYVGETEKPLCGKERSVSKDEAAQTDLSELFSAISTADELRVRNQMNAKLIEADAQNLKRLVYNELYACAMRGEYSVTVIPGEISELATASVAAELAKCEFSVEGDNGELVISFAPWEFDYRGVTEEQCCKRFPLRLAKAYSYIAGYCQNVRIPQLLCDAVRKVASALDTTNAESGSIIIAKEQTKTNAYERLFSALVAKGYSVVDRENSFEVRW